MLLVSKGELTSVTPKKEEKEEKAEKTQKPEKQRKLEFFQKKFETKYLRM